MNDEKTISSELYTREDEKSRSAARLEEKIPDPAADEGVAILKEAIKGEALTEEGEKS